MTEFSETITTLFRIFSTAFAAAVFIGALITLWKYRMSRNRFHILLMILSYSLLTVLDLLGWVSYVYLNHPITAAILSSLAYPTGLLGLWVMAHNRQNEGKTPDAD